MMQWTPGGPSCCAICQVAGARAHGSGAAMSDEPSSCAASAAGVGATVASIAGLLAWDAAGHMGGREAELSADTGAGCGRRQRARECGRPTVGALGVQPVGCRDRGKRADACSRRRLLLLQHRPRNQPLASILHSFPERLPYKPPVDLLVKPASPDVELGGRRVLGN